MIKILLYFNIIYHWIKIFIKILSNRGIIENFKLLTDIKNIKSKFGILFPKGFGILVHNPLVSVLIVSYNSSRDLLDLFPTLEEQYYKNFEVILVENGSEDNSSLSNKFNLNVKYIKSEHNLGFAAGNNLALKHSSGEFIALINPDTKVSKSWLLEMVNLLKENCNTAAIAPKIYFYERFTDILFESDLDFSFELDELNKNLSYPKYFILIGRKINNHSIESIKNKISIRLPIDESKFEIKISSKYSNYITMKLTDLTYKIFLKNQNEDFIRVNIDLTTQYNSSSKWLINNAGSSIGKFGPFDRGFGEYDNINYDKIEYISALCGCSFLIRRIAIFERYIFNPVFFAYYEDSELSHWLLEKKYKILYCPKSIVYHKHSVSSEEGSLVWQTLVNRSKLYYNYYTDSKNKRKKILNQIKIFSYSSNLPYNLKNILKDLDNKFLKNHSFYEKIYDKSITIYNSFWNSKGGGEAHALSFAVKIQKYQKVFLVSGNNFDISELEKYFNLDLYNCTKLIIPKLSKNITLKFDVFINSTYCSNVISYAKKSYFIVSFPHKRYDNNIIKYYTFLYNSTYTKKWAEIYWKNAKSEIILPIIGRDNLIQQNTNIKENIILSVGRFTLDGHNKNHDKIIQAFINIQKKYYELNKWKLVIAGSLNQNNKKDINYFLYLKEISKDFNIELIPNISYESLNQLYKITTIYIHATGLGLSESSEPEKFEHFGITNFEAICNGCIPLVFNIGGPAELNKELEVGYYFDSQVSLESKLEELTFSLFNKDLISQNNDYIKKVSNILEKNNKILDKILKEII